MANQVLYGFRNLNNVMDERVSTVGVDVVMTAITTTLAEHNRQIDAVMDIFAEPTTEFKTRFWSANAARLQPLDENGRALPIRPAGYHDVELPIQAGATAWGANRISMIKMTVAEVQRHTAMMMSADIRWMRDHVLSALFIADGWTFADEEHGNLTVEGLANGDAITYQIRTGQDLPAVDTHILAQASAIDDSNNPYDNIYTELTEHPENGGEVVCLIPTALKATTIALTNFYDFPDPRLNYGTGTTTLSGTLPQAVPGEVLGYTDKCWIVEWPALPSEHILAFTTEGDKPLAMRQHAEAELQGFQFVAEREDHPFREVHWERWAGFGGWNRVGAVAYRVGNASYAVPTGYGAPLA